MCDMQKMPTTEDDSCEEETDMNFAFSTMGGAGTHYVTTGGQLPVAKLQQTMANNGNLPQVVSMMGGDGVQYVRTLDGGTTINTPQLFSVPIALPGAKPGDPQPTVQIQVLSPNILQQQPKYQMQIPIQGFQQGVITVAYSPETNEQGGIQLIGNSLPEGFQVLAALPQEMQLVQPSQMHTPKKEPIPQHQVFITANNQIIINGPEDKVANNNNIENIIIKEECEKDEDNEDESSQGTESSGGWATMGGMATQPHADLLKYLNTLPPQQTQALPVSLQQFLKMNPSESKIEMEVEETTVDDPDDPGPKEIVIIEEDGTPLLMKKKKKYKKKPPKPARPKPGQVIIAEAADGTPIFCCPECQMAYPEKEQLEMHLIVHKIERRFICGICGAGLKRKEHLERHKMGHNPERPFVCGVCRKGFKRREHLNLHTVIHSGVKTELCGECGKGFYRKDHLRKHTRSHESKRARDEANGDVSQPTLVSQPTQTTQTTQQTTQTIMPEITIHVPTSSNMQVPVQINIPQHVVSSLAAQAQVNAGDAQAQLDALLAQHT